MKKYLLILFISCFATTAKSQGIITTIAGDGTPSYLPDSGAATSIGLYFPYGVALDRLGNYYISDGYNDRICKVNAAGFLTTIAGTGTGGYNGDSILATTSELYGPNGMVFDQVGNLYFADAHN